MKIVFCRRCGRGQGRQTQAWEANLVFDGRLVVRTNVLNRFVNASLDTGANTTDLNANFADMFPDVVAKGRKAFTVVGVMPEGFAFPVNHQYWIALRANPSAIARGAGPVLFVFGRLAPGATMASAQAELSAIGQRTAAEFPQTNATLKPQVLGYTKPINDVQDMGIGTWVMMQLTISLVLVVVALNVAILLYARTATRRGEIAVRTALGASRGRIVIQLFIEALVLALVPALLGLALGQYATEIGTEMMAQELGGAAPFWLDHGIQPSTMVYVLVLVVVTAAIAGILPALHATRRRGGADIRQLGGSTGIRLGRIWSALIVVQGGVCRGRPARGHQGWYQRNPRQPHATELLRC